METLNQNQPTVNLSNMKPYFNNIATQELHLNDGIVIMCKEFHGAVVGHGNVINHNGNLLPAQHSENGDILKASFNFTELLPLKCRATEIREDTIVYGRIVVFNHIYANDVTIIISSNLEKLPVKQSHSQTKDYYPEVFAS